MSKITIKDIVKRYRDKYALYLRDQTSTILPGITSIIGPNGSGKSTLLQCIDNIIPYDGFVYIDTLGCSTRDIDRDKMALTISFLKQSTNFDIRISIKDLVSFGRFPYSKGNLNQEDKDIINESMNYMDLYNIKDKYIDNISGGERQRTLIAMMLAQNTPIMLLDEPLNNLDMKHSRDIMKKLRNLADNHKKTIVIVIHDINFASRYSDRIIAIRQGKIVADDITNNIVNQSVLKDIYGIDIDVFDYNGIRYCNYF